MDWARSLYGRSGYVEGHALPLSYLTIAAWSYLTGERPEPQEVDALIAMDEAIRNPVEPEPEEP